MPRQPGGATSIDTEARWLPVVGPSLPVAVPEVLHVGEPGFGHPTRWSVLRWLDGEVPSVPAGNDRRALTGDLADVVLALRDLDVPPEAPSDPSLTWYRCRPLADHDEGFRHWLAACRRLDDSGLDLDRVEAMWDAAMALPGASEVGPSWLHGDLVAENLLVRDGRLAAVLDFGGLGIGDPTVDLGGGLGGAGPAARAVFRESVAPDDDTWLRGRAWALYLVAMTLPYYGETMPERCRHRLAAARAALADAA